MSVELNAYLFFPGNAKRFKGAGAWPKTVRVIGSEFAGLWLSSRLCAAAHQGSSVTPSRAHG
jgi:hypothetical protein